MSKVTSQYANVNNGGSERVTKDGENYFVDSDFGNGFRGEVKVTREQMAMCLQHTSAPADIVNIILGN